MQTQRRSFLINGVTIKHSRGFRASTIDRSRGCLQVVIHHMGKNMNRVRPILGLRCARSCNLHRKAHRDKKFSYRILHLNQDLAINENRRKSTKISSSDRAPSRAAGKFPQNPKNHLELQGVEDVGELREATSADGDEKRRQAGGGRPSGRSVDGDGHPRKTLSIP